MIFIYSCIENNIIEEVILDDLRNKPIKKLKEIAINEYEIVKSFNKTLDLKFKVHNALMEKMQELRTQFITAEKHKKILCDNNNDIDNTITIFEEKKLSLNLNNNKEIEQYDLNIINKFQYYYDMLKKQLNNYKNTEIITSEKNEIKNTNIIIIDKLEEINNKNITKDELKEIIKYLRIQKIILEQNIEIQSQYCNELIQIQKKFSIELNLELNELIKVKELSNNKLSFIENIIKQIKNDMKIYKNLETNNEELKKDNEYENKKYILIMNLEKEINLSKEYFNQINELYIKIENFNKDFNIKEYNYPDKANIL